MLATPVEANKAPLPKEFKQPAPAPTAELLAHGQAVLLPSPKQNAPLVGAPVSPALMAVLATVS
jgi:hypothetical protein